MGRVAIVGKATNGWKCLSLLYHKHATNCAHLTLIFYFLRWVPQFLNFGIWIKWMAHLILVLKSKMENFIGKSWPFHSCLYNCVGHWKLTTLTTNCAQSMFIQLLLEALQKKHFFVTRTTVGCLSTSWLWRATPTSICYWKGGKWKSLNQSRENARREREA